MDSIETVSSQDRKSTDMQSMQRTESVSALPIPDFFGKEVFQTVLDNSTAANCLLRFAQSHGHGEDMEYLMRVGPCMNESVKRKLMIPI